MNVTEIRDSDFKNAFPGIFNFTVGILVPLILPFSTSNGPPTSALSIDSFGESVVVGYNSGLINLYELSDTVDVTKIIPTRTIRHGVRDAKFTPTRDPLTWQSR